ncbi:MAG: TIGR01777 family oxidoreductase [Planctomyces sp.]|nr:TIGR01777 family oxidoreductase [Planctomyces sp.]
MSSTVAVSGATGLVGKELCSLLKATGHKVLALSRKQSEGYEDSIHWDADKGITNPARLESVDTIVHLAGENIAAGRWNDALKARIRSSRVAGTRSIVNSLRGLKKRPSTLICASAIGLYGDQGDKVLDETAGPGSGFLPDVCREWEAEAVAAESLGLRVVRVRIGVVLSPQGGALAKMLLPFKLGVGGIIGSGRQYWSWIGLHDLTRVLAWCVQTPSISGPVNAVSPQPMTNRDFTKTLAGVLHRPAIFPMPAFAARLALGEMANDLLLASTRVVPKRLLDSGFEFQNPDLKSCLEHELA